MSFPISKHIDCSKWDADLAGIIYLRFRWHWVIMPVCCLCDMEIYLWKEVQRSYPFIMCYLKCWIALSAAWEAAATVSCMPTRGPQGNCGTKTTFWHRVLLQDLYSGKIQEPPYVSVCVLYSWRFQGPRGSEVLGQLPPLPSSWSSATREKVQSKQTDRKPVRAGGIEKAHPNCRSKTRGRTEVFWLSAKLPLNRKSVRREESLSPAEQSAC